MSRGSENRNQKAMSKGKITASLASYYSVFNNLVTSHSFEPPKRKYQGQTKADAELKINKAKEKRERKLARNKLNAGRSKENQY